MEEPSTSHLQEGLAQLPASGLLPLSFGIKTKLRGTAGRPEADRSTCSRCSGSGYTQPPSVDESSSGLKGARRSASYLGAGRGGTMAQWGPGAGGASEGDSQDTAVMSSRGQNLPHPSKPGTHASPDPTCQAAPRSSRHVAMALASRSVYRWGPNTPHVTTVTSRVQKGSPGNETEKIYICGPQTPKEQAL